MLRRIAPHFALDAGIRSHDSDALPVKSERSRWVGLYHRLLPLALGPAAESKYSVKNSKAPFFKGYTSTTNGESRWPSCDNCIKRGCICQYPTVFKHSQQGRVISEVHNNPRPLVYLSGTPTSYSANDMRLFHHFLIAAHPCIPHEYEAVWVNDVPAFSYQVSQSLRYQH